MPFANNDVCIHVTRRFDCAQGNGFGDHRDQQCAVRVGFCGNLGQIADAPQYVGILHDNTRCFAIDPRQQPRRIGFGNQFGRGRDQIITRKPRHRLRNAHVMRVQTRRQQRLAALGDPPRHDDRFPARSRTIVHAGIGDITAEQARDLRLEFEQHLQRALRDFGLIRRVGGQKFAALDDMVDARGDMMTVSAAPEEKRPLTRRTILAREGRQMSFDRQFSGMVRQAMNGARQARAFGHINEQRVDIGRTDDGQHRRTVMIGQRQITHQSPATNAL